MRSSGVAPSRTSVSNDCFTYSTNAAPYGVDITTPLESVARREVELLLFGRFALRRVDHPVALHGIEHLRPAGERLLRPGDGIELLGRADNAGEERGFSEGQPQRRLVEERLCCRLDPVGPASEVDRVQVLLEDLILGERALEPPRQNDLVPLALDRLGPVVEIDVASELHRDRAAALLDPTSGRVDDERTPQSRNVDAVVRREALVLDRDDRVANVHRYGGERDGFAVLLAVQDREELPVAGVDLGARVHLCGRSRQPSDLVDARGKGLGPGTGKLSEHDGRDDETHNRVAVTPANSIGPRASRNRPTRRRQDGRETAL